MDRIDSPLAPGAPAAPATSAGSQSRLSPVLFWIVAAAVLFRVLTSVMDRPPGDELKSLVKWQALERAPELARANGKVVLYEFGAAWCGPCKLLDKQWADPGVADKVNGRYVAARVVDRQREDGRNPPEVEELQRRYEISAFPTVVAAAPDGRMLGKLEGYSYGMRERLQAFLEKPAAP